MFYRKKERVMKKYASYGLGSLAALALAVACDNGTDFSRNSEFYSAEERMMLTASSESIELNGNDLESEVLTFEWTPAREMSEEHQISYVTKLDIEGNNFNSCVRTEEEEDVFSRSYTTEQLQRLLTEKWGKNHTRSTMLQFRVLAKWSGGTRYTMPEVRTVSVAVRPYRPIVFDADKVFLSGTAVPGTTRHAMTRTRENEYQWAALLDLAAGELQMPVEFDGDTNYLCPADGEGSLLDGEAEPVAMKSEPVTWMIPADGRYRVVVDMESKTVTIYSPEKDLQPKVVEWRPNNLSTNPLIRTEVTALWVVGEPAWGGKAINCTQSLADPQILVYDGDAFRGRCKFTLVGPSGVVAEGNSYSISQAYCFTAPLVNGKKVDSAPMSQGVWMPLEGGSDTDHKNTYYNIPSGTNFIIFDLRNMRIRAEKR